MSEVFDNQEIRDLEKVIEDIFQEVEHLAGIRLYHSSGMAILTIHTPTGIQENYGSHVRINTESGETVLPLDICLDSSGVNTIENRNNTVLYICDSVVGADARSLDEGLDILRKKLDRESEDSPSKGDSI